MKSHASMNRIYRLVWSHSLGVLVAVAENAKGRGKSRSSRGLVSGALALAGGLFLLPFAQAGPAGGQVSAGSGSIAQVGTTTTINQGSQNLAINWQSFSIAPNEAVRFNQPNASAIALNRVTSQSPSQIMGSLSANGQVFVLNPNGVLFGAGAQVSVGGLVASTLGLGDTDFMKGNFAFQGVTGAKGTVTNQGTLTAAQGGYIALLAPEVRNQGVVLANRGTALLAAGDKVTLQLNNGSLLAYSIDQGAINALADNQQLIQADGGQILMTAKAANALSTAVVNNTGILEARTVQNVAGVIKLMGDMQTGTVNVGGTLDASAPHGGNGGFIETSAANVRVANDAKVTTAAAMGLAGTWLIDPIDFTITAGTDLLTNSGIGASTLGTSLGSTNVSVASSGSANGSDIGDINVNAPVSWSANTLTLNAQNNININANLNGSGTASLALQYGQRGNTVNITNSSYSLNNGAQVNLPAGLHFSTQLGSDGTTINYTVITSLGAAGSTTSTDLQGVNGGLSGNYALGGNIDATTTSTWNGAAGFTPIGNSSTAFSGTFDGLGHTISNLKINLPSQDYVGLFGQTNSGAVIQNLGLVGGSVIGGNGVGGLVGVNTGTISNSFATGSVSAGNYVGGLVGHNYGTISNSYATGSVSAGNYVGGLVGANNGTIRNSYATGSDRGGSYVGGLVGLNYGEITNSYATGSVDSGGDRAGGLVGHDQGGVINNSYATGSVRSDGKTGGLVGWSNGTFITNSYATGSVSGPEAGGLVGQNNSGTISNSYATGSVSAGNYVGGLVGFNLGGTISNSYWNTTNNPSMDPVLGGVGSGIATGATGLSSVQMQNAANFGGFNFTSTLGASGNNWVIVNADGTLQTGTATSGGATTPMLASEYATSIHNAHQLQLMAMAPGASYTLSQNINAAGTSSGGDVWGSAGFVPVGNSATPFPGSFDGLGHTISNLTINRPTSDYVGLFGYADVASVIQNVGLINASVTGRDYVGGLVGDNDGTIINSYATGNVTGDNGVGGLVGYNSQGTISNSYATGNVTGTGYDVGGLVGYVNNMASVTNSHYDIDSVLINGNHQVTPYGVYGTQFTDWLTNSKTLNIADYTSLTLSDDSYYQISAVQGLKDLLGFADNNAYKFLLTANLGLSSLPGYYIPYFAGTFSGAGHALDHFSISLPKNTSIGFIGVLANASLLNNLGLTNVVVAGGDAVGGLVGSNYGTIRKSYATGNVSGRWAVGGLVGFNANSGTISYSYATGKVTGTGYYIGGLVGDNYGAITNSYASASVTGDTFVGGLVGYNDNEEGRATITNSYATGSVTGDYMVGGLAGYSDGTITNSYATGSVAGTGNEVGGLVGGNSGTITNSYATGSVTGSDNVGGFVGSNFTGAISNSYATGNVKGTGDNIGGLVGENDGYTSDIRDASTITNSYATGSVKGGSSVGGLVGYNGNGVITDSYWNSDINTIGIGSYSNVGDTSGATGLTSAQMQDAANFVGFNFTSTPGASGNNWVIVNGDGSLYVRSDPESITIGGGTTNGGGTSPMLASEYSTSINNTHQLQLMAMAPSASYILSGNIDAAATALIGGKSTDVWGSAGFIPVGYAGINWYPGAPSAGIFTGSFDGLGHTISKLTINRPTNDFVGLFGIADVDSVIKNVGLTNASVTGANGVGGLVGINFGTISNSYAASPVSGTHYVGGLVGYNSGTITNSYATGNVTGTGDYVGGLVGANEFGTISNSYASGSVTGTFDNVGGLVGRDDNGTISNSYWNRDIKAKGIGSDTNVGDTSGATGLSSVQMQNAANFAGFNFTSTPGASGNNWVIVNANGTLQTGTETSGGATTPMLASEYATNINNTHQLQLMVMAPTASYTLSGNIDAAATALTGGNSTDVWGSAGFIPVGKSSTPFTGSFDGTGHTINKLTINSFIMNDVGLFGVAGATSVIQNVGLINATVNGSSNVGSLVGSNSGTISNIYTTGSVTGNADNVGALVGKNNGTISNSYVASPVSGTHYVGGLVGYNSGTITNSYATSPVTGSSSGVGGLVGYNDSTGTITNSYASGSVSGTGDDFGGLVGRNSSGTISNSYWNSDIKAKGIGSDTNVGDTSGATGLSSEQMQDAANFMGFNFTSTSGARGNNWVIVNGDGSLNDSSSSSSGTNGGGTSPMLASEYSTSINNAHQLQLMVMAPSASYALSGNIDAAATGLIGGNSTDVWGSAGFIPIGKSGTPFTGSFDGLGHTISQLTINRPTSDEVGLFGKTSAGSVVQNVGLVGGSVIARGYVGGLAGSNGGLISNSYATGSVVGRYDLGGLVGINLATISNSYATGSVTGTGGYVGGLVGYNDNSSSITNSYATASVVGNYVLGGLAGGNSGSIINSYATGSVTGTADSVGGLVGANFSTITNSYATGIVTGGYNVGGLVGYNNGTISNSHWNSDISAIGIGSDTNVGDTSGATGLTSLQMQNAANFGGFNFTSSPGASGNNWVIVNADGTLQTGTATSGGATTPMLASEYATSINNAHQLQLMAMAPAASYTLNGNIDAATTGSGGDVWGSAGFIPVGYRGKNWNPGAPFAGSFDGLGNTISNLTINTPFMNDVGLFGYTDDASVIKNVGLINASVSGNSDVGALVGSNSGTISSSYATGSVAGTSDTVGGLVGYNNSGTISNSYATGSVTGTGGYVGGLVGSNFVGTISNSSATGNVTGTGDYVGGLVGSNFVGTISNSSATGNVTGTGDYVGGLVGGNSGFSNHSSDIGTITNSYATGNVTGRSSVGGLVGNNGNGAITNSNAMGNVTGTGYNVGGLVGYNDGTINNSYATGNVTSTGDWYVGGLVGYNGNGTISNSYAAGNVTGTGYGVGGLVGYVDTMASVTNSHYDIDRVLINGNHQVTPYGLYGVQYRNWSGSKTLNIADYSSTCRGICSLPLSGGYYQISDVQGLKDLLGFADNNAYKFRLTANLDLSSLPGYYIPYFAGHTFDGAGYALDLFSISQPKNDRIGFIGVLANGSLLTNLGLTHVDVTGSSAGGLVGSNYGTISNSYAMGSMTAIYYAGGLVQNNYGTINNSYATGSVTGSFVGGLVQYNSGTISNSYATGSVTGLDAGGLVLYNGGTVINSYWNTTNNPSLAGIAYGDADGVTGLSTTQMQTASSFSGWDMSNTGGSSSVWRIYEGNTAPLLTSFLAPLTLSNTPDASMTYNGVAQSGATTASSLVLGSAATGTNAGFYNGYYSTQQGYDITGGNLTIGKAPLAVTGLTANNKVYDASNAATISGAASVTALGSDVVTLTGTASGTFSDPNVGNGKTVTTTGLILGGTGAGNYTLVQQTGLSADIVAGPEPVQDPVLATAPYSAAKAQPAAPNADWKNVGSEGLQRSPFRDAVYGGIQVSPNGGIRLAADMLFGGESEQFALDK